jgi:hypothetical protein
MPEIYVADDGNKKQIRRRGERNGSTDLKHPAAHARSFQFWLQRKLRRQRVPVWRNRNGSVGPHADATKSPTVDM